MQESASERAKYSRGAFPRVPLTKVLELTDAVFQIGHGDPVRRLSVFDYLGKSPSSGTSRELVTAANSGYGVAKGGYSAEYLELTVRGQEIHGASNESTKYAAIYDALFDNSVFSEFVSHFKDRPFPNDEVAVDYLVREHSLAEAEARKAWDVFRQNLDDFALVHILSDKRVIVERETALREFGVGAGLGSSGLNIEASTQPDDVPFASSIVAPKVAPSPDSLPIPEMHVNIQIHLPDSASPGTYDAIFESIGRHLLGRQFDDGVSRN